MNDALSSGRNRDRFPEDWENTAPVERKSVKKVFGVSRKWIVVE